MDARFEGLDGPVSLQGMLGYLNFSEGKPDARFQKQLSDAYRYLAERGAEEPYKVLHELLAAKLAALKAGGTSAFQDVTQAQSVLRLVFHQVLPAYRQHHADLLFHLTDRELFQPFFLARVFEAVLSQGGPWDKAERIVSGALSRLNDYVGHRPIAILETRPRGEPYDHERVRPIPLFLQGAGVACGRYHDLIEQTLQILRSLPAAGGEGILRDAYFDPEVLDELALDPRAYDHGHPVNRRPNYVFGEWDPHHIDNQGRYRRFVVRQIMLDALLDRVEHPGDLSPADAMYEAAAVLAGTMLMASGTSGSGPSTHDSTTTLASLMPSIARYRDAFYAALLKSAAGPRGERLRQEMTRTRQPFGGARQHLNQYLARHRAAQLQQRYLALLFAQMGYPEASRREAAKIPVASARMLSEILGRLTTGQTLADRGELAEAARLLPEVEDLLHRGIACGALADPWNILGFQGLFPLFQAREDSVRDPRIDELIQIMEDLFNLYARLLSKAAAAGEQALVKQVKPELRRLAAWWDRFASTGVSDVRPVHGGEAVASAEHVTTALASWHERGDAAGDLRFWRQHLEGFRSPKAFALVVDALLREQDYRAALALLMNWLSQVEQVPLEEGDYSFHALALRWMLGMAGDGSWELIQKFFDHLEANADDYWHVPALELTRSEEGEEEDEEDLYGAAYEDVTYQDSTDDKEGMVADGGGPQEEFDLEVEADRIGKRLNFLTTVARLWQIAARRVPSLPEGQAASLTHDALAQWLAVARKNQRGLLELLDVLHGYQVPEPLGSYDSLVEYDRRRVLKEQLLYAAIGTDLDTALAVGTLQGVSGTVEAAPAAGRPGWEAYAVRLERAVMRGDAEAVRAELPGFLELFQQEPLLFTALAEGGDPRQILRVRINQALLRALVTTLPRLGLIRETYHLLKTARVMEQANPPRGRSVTEFNQLFQAGYQAAVENVVESVAAWTPSPYPLPLRQGERVG